MNIPINTKRREILEQLELAQESLQSENHNTKSEITILQDKFSKESFNIGNDTPVGISEASLSSRTDIGDPSALVSKQIDEFEEKTENKSIKSGSNSSPIITLNTSEEINGDRIKETEHEFESYRIAKENLAMEKALETKQLIEIINENTQLKLKIENIEEEIRQRMEENLNLLKEQTNLKLLKFRTLKESLLKDLKNRCK
ncbi:hypothetical protein DICPUDRAFT_84525 [Dictyostelium purpureum]|uniref:Uncharacterized protein n=1 Tax=Dictyostelium purpureum TaxID=5786 RepID=F1A2X5_DICPU|nr:uncharacterized protein DICPUDRAFT_84525 [Dictyostelium purpureum]EGC29452.1 hypothetical protein DICPUDRAFT_84525 [Dictyostelium purpureum]|eukprot:XP_003294018.1 hypothetical protein DICPUDRAFT_84525 [Dictyostelium purpureum]